MVFCISYCGLVVLVWLLVVIVRLVMMSVSRDVVVVFWLCMDREMRVVSIVSVVSLSVIV